MLDAVADGVAVHVELLGNRCDAAAMGEVEAQELGELGALTAVVLLEGFECRGVIIGQYPHVIETEKQAECSHGVIVRDGNGGAARAL